MPDWVPWLIAAAALAAGEVLSLGLVLGFLAVGALIAALVALGGGGLGFQILAFLLGSLLLLVLVRPIARRHLHTPARIRTGAEALVGQRAVVLERVDADGGRVRLAGEIWSARAWDDQAVIEPGARVEVMKIEGATALVHE
jgi:membrane protein implicated in regulation of membrane protease activity